VDERQRKTLTRQVVLDAAQHQRAAVARRAGPHFFRRHPQRAHDAFIQRALRIEGPNSPEKAKRR
jgi:hypothetical protein